MPANIGIKVEGLRELRRALTLADELLPAELREELRALGEIVERVAKGKFTGQFATITGRHLSSIRSAPAGASVSVKEGGASAPGMGWLDFGGTVSHVGPNHSHEHEHLLRRPVVSSGRVLYPAGEEAAAVVALETDRMLDRVFARAGWS